MIVKLIRLLGLRVWRVDSQYPGFKHTSWNVEVRPGKQRTAASVALHVKHKLVPREGDVFLEVRTSAQLTRTGDRLWGMDFRHWQPAHRRWPDTDTDVNDQDHHETIIRHAEAAREDEERTDPWPA